MPEYRTADSIPNQVLKFGGSAEHFLFTPKESVVKLHGQVVNLFCRL